jgi:hypothetical protein
MATVNPPPIPRLPPQWLSDPDIRAYQTAVNKIIFQLWIKTGSGSSSEVLTDDDIAGEFYYLLAQLNNKQEVDVPDIHYFQSQINAIRKEIEDLKNEHATIMPLSSIDARLRDIEEFI